MGLPRPPRKGWQGWKERETEGTGWAEGQEGPLSPQISTWSSSLPSFSCSWQHVSGDAPSLGDS